jgi:hypothetical protein
MDDCWLIAADKSSWLQEELSLDLALLPGKQAHYDAPLDMVPVSSNVSPTAVLQAEQATVELVADLHRARWETERRAAQLEADLERADWQAEQRAAAVRQRGSSGGKGLPPPVVSAAVRRAERAEFRVAQLEATMHREQWRARQRAAQLETDLQRARWQSHELVAQLETDLTEAHSLADSRARAGDQSRALVAQLEANLKEAHSQARASDQRVASVEADLDRLQQCTVCLVAPRSVLIRPCGHLCLCEECATRLLETTRKKCPCCRTGFYKKNLVFGIKMP